MRLFVGVLLVTMVVMATLIDHSEGWRRRGSGSGSKAEKQKKVVEEAKDFLEEVRELEDNLLEAVVQGNVDREEDDARK